MELPEMTLLAMTLPLEMIAKMPMELGAASVPPGLTPMLSCVTTLLPPETNNTP